MPLYGSTNENAWMHFKKKHFSSKKAHLFIYRFLPYKSLSKVRTSEFCHAIHAVNHAVNHAVLRNWRQTVSWTNLSPRLRIRFLPDFLEAIALCMECQNEKELIIKSIKSQTVQILTNLFTTKSSVHCTSRWFYKFFVKRPSLYLLSVIQELIQI